MYKGRIIILEHAYNMNIKKSEINLNIEVTPKS